VLTVDFDRLGVQPGDRVLDLGCGAGRHSFEALRHGADVVAADLDRRLLHEVAVLAVAMEVEGETALGATFEAVHANALDLPFEDGSFDHVIASEVLEHIPDDEVAIKEIVRVLKPGATAAVTVPRYWPEAVCWALSSEYHSNEGGHVRIYRAPELKRRLRSAGLMPRAVDYAHALHSPYWWIKCAVGVRKERALLPRAYHRFLVWDIEASAAPTRLLERSLNPIMGKSLVVYAARKDGLHA
jgi:ubiquinone/menaquinone biosynthesis C-methylase UbiE